MMRTVVFSDEEAAKAINEQIEKYLEYDKTNYYFARKDRER